MVRSEFRKGLSWQGWWEVVLETEDGDLRLSLGQAEDLLLVRDLLAGKGWRIDYRIGPFEVDLKPLGTLVKVTDTTTGKVYKIPLSDSLWDELRQELDGLREVLREDC